MEVGKMNVPWLAVGVRIVNVSYLLRKCRLDCVLSKSIINNFFGKLEFVGLPPLFFCLRSDAVDCSGILSIQMFPKELTEWILRIALIYTFMRVTLMQITLVLPPMRITFVRSAAQKARLFRFQTHSHLYCTESQIQTY